VTAAGPGVCQPRCGVAATWHAATSDRECRAGRSSTLFARQGEETMGKKWIIARIALGGGEP
jgi:hypothetical protein